MKLKSKIFKSEFSDLSVEVIENGWIILHSETEKTDISLGTYPNARIDLILQALEYAEYQKMKKKEKKK